MLDPMPVARPVLVEFPADDPRRACRFWSGLLGAELEPRAAAQGSGWQTNGDEAVAVGVHVRGRGPGDSFSLPYFEVDEMAAALEAGILCFNVESEPELRDLSEVASGRGLVAPVSVRVNPDVDARTHAKISTGRSQNKFGIPISRAREVYAEAKGNGFDVKALRTVIRLRKQDENKRREEEAVLTTYLHALGMADAEAA